MNRIPSQRPALPLLLLLLLLWGALQLPATATEHSYSDVTDVTVVEVPVQVTHRGEPVRGLDAAEFRIFDEGEPREIGSFEVVDQATGSPAGPAGSAGPTPRRADEQAEPLPSALRRHFLLLFDLAFSTPEDVIRAERAARELVETGLAPSDLVGVAVYTPRRGAATLLRFTSDHGQVLGVLDGLRALLDGSGPETEEAADLAARTRTDPLRLSTGITQANLADLGASQGIQRLLMEEAIAWAGPFDGLGGTGELSKMQNFYRHMNQALADRRAGDVADFTDSLTSLAAETAGIAGSKHLVLFSRGFDVRLLQVRTRSEKDPVPGADAGAVAGQFAVGGGSWILEEVNAMIDAMRRAGWSIHAVEMAGTRDRSWNFRESLFFVADETGGALYENANDPLVALAEVVERTAVTYLLTFQVSELPEEPLLRRLRVEVDGLPRGARVVHRAAYEPPRNWNDLSPARRRAESAEALLAGADRDNLGLDVLALPYRAGGGAWSVPVALEVDGLSLLAGALERTPGAEIYAYAFDADGGVADLLAHRVDVRDADARGRLTERGLKFLGDLSLPAGGDYRLRFLVRSLRNGETALRTVPLHLPASSADDDRSVLLPPVLLEAGAPGESGWIVTTEVDPAAGISRDAVDASPAAPASPSPPASKVRPFTLHGRALTPAVGSLRVAGSAGGGPAPDSAGRFLILGYGLDRSAQSLHVELRGPDGRSAGRPTVLARTPGEGPEPDLLLATLPPGLTPGAYTLEITLAADDGTVRARTTRRFRVEGTGTGS